VSKWRGAADLPCETAVSRVALRRRGKVMERCWAQNAGFPERNARTLYRHLPGLCDLQFAHMNNSREKRRVCQPAARGAGKDRRVGAPRGAISREICRVRPRHFTLWARRAASVGNRAHALSVPFGESAAPWFQCHRAAKGQREIRPWAAYAKTRSTASARRVRPLHLT
jgi:hypothetical protein